MAPNVPCLLFEAHHRLLPSQSLQKCSIKRCHISGVSLLQSPRRDDGTCSTMREHDAEETLPRVSDETGVVAEEEGDRPPPDDDDHEIPPWEEHQNYEILPRREEIAQVTILSTCHTRRPPWMAELHGKMDPTPTRKNPMQILPPH